MTTIEDLLRPDGRWRRVASKSEMDPLTKDDALQEAQLIGVRIDALSSTVGLLFELRVALQLRETNTGVLVARGVREVSWVAQQRSTGRTAWVVAASRLELDEQRFGLRLSMWPEARLVVAGRERGVLRR